MILEAFTQKGVREAILADLDLLLTVALLSSFNFMNLFVT